MTTDFPKYPNGSVFTAYSVNLKQINTIEFDCIRYGNLLKNNKIIVSKSQEKVELWITTKKATKNRAQTWKTS